MTEELTRPERFAEFALATERRKSRKYSIRKRRRMRRPILSLRKRKQPA